MLAQERRQRLAAAMGEAGIDHLVLYGNAWQGDYLRYGADFGILEGHGIALIAADGAVELFLDSATDAERAEVEAPGVAVHFAPRYRRARSARGSIASPTAASPRRRGGSCRAGSSTRRAASPSSDGNGAARQAADAQAAGEIAAMRRAAQIADDAYAEFRKRGAAGPPPIRDRRRYRGAICAAAAARTIS